MNISPNLCLISEHLSLFQHVYANQDISNQCFWWYWTGENMQAQLSSWRWSNTFRIFLLSKELTIRNHLMLEHDWKHSVRVFLTLKNKPISFCESNLEHHIGSYIDVDEKYLIDSSLPKKVILSHSNSQLEITRFCSLARRKIHITMPHFLGWTHTQNLQSINVYTLLKRHVLKQSRTTYVFRTFFLVQQNFLETSDSGNSM